MKVKATIKRVIAFYKDQSIDIRIRMMFFLEYASFIACLVGTIFMILLKQPVESMYSNIILFVMSFISLYLSHAKKKYELSTAIMIIGCANVALPWMYFTAGGNDSGMLIWLVFGVAVTCLMTKGKIRVWMILFTFIEDMVFICIGHFCS